MIKRVLLLLNYIENNKSIINFTELLKLKYNIELSGLFINDIKKYEIFPTYSGYSDNTHVLLLEQLKIIEDKKANETRNIFQESFKDSNFEIVNGIVDEIVLEKMKNFDLLITAKPESFDENLKHILGHHYKPLILVPNNDVCGIENIIYANDGEYNANKSIFNYLNLFSDTKRIKMISSGINKEFDEEIDYYKKKGVQVDLITKEKKGYSELLDETKCNDLLVMGDLKHFYTYEKFTKKTGVNLLEKVKLPVFIG